jgi:hypothetical protein
MNIFLFSQPDANAATAKFELSRKDEHSDFKPEFRDKEMGD